MTTSTTSPTTTTTCTSKTTSSTATCTTTMPGTTCTINEISSPGCYVCNWNGSLLRVNESCFDSSNNTWFSFCSNDTLTVTFLCENPYTSIGECRDLAKTYRVPCNY